MKNNDDHVYITHDDLEQLIEVLTQSRDCFAITAKIICDFLSEYKATEIHQTIYFYARMFFEKEKQLNQQLNRLGINTQAHPELSDQQSDKKQNGQQAELQDEQCKEEYNPQIVNETDCFEINLLNFFIQSKLQKTIPEQLKTDSTTAEYNAAQYNIMKDSNKNDK